ITVAARGSKTVQWTVSADDIDLEPFIFNKVAILPDGSHSTRQAICGTLVLSIPGTGGGQVFLLSVIESLLALTLGYAVWENKFDVSHANLQRAVHAIGVTVSLAMLTAFMGWWAVGIVFCVAALLLALIILRFTIA